MKHLKFWQVVILCLALGGMIGTVVISSGSSNHDHSDASNGGTLGTGVVDQDVIADDSVGTGELKLATGTFSHNDISTAGDNDVFAMNQYAFGSPSIGFIGNGRAGSSIPHEAYTQNGPATPGTERKWRVDWAAGPAHTDDGTVTWDYITASENPSVWAEISPSGDIITIWESEDPIDKNNPTIPPIVARGLNRIVDITSELSNPVFWTDIEIRTSNRQDIERVFKRRNKEVPDSLNDVVTNPILTSQQKRWQIQIWARAVVKSEGALNLSSFIMNTFNVSPSNKLQIRG